MSDNGKGAILLFSCLFAFFLSTCLFWFFRAKGQRREKPLLSLYFQRLDPRAKLPIRASDQSVGWDFSAIDSQTIPPRSRAWVRTGLATAVPLGYYLRAAPRSGLASKYAIDVGAGVIDADYRGEVKILLINSGTQKFCIQPGDRIGQGILERAGEYEPVWVEELPETDRGTKGFGSSGVHAQSTTS